MSGNDLINAIYEGIIYDITKYVIGPLIVTACLSIILKKVFHKLSAKKETIHFWVASFIAICTLFYFIGSTKDGPLLSGGIQSIMAGGVPGTHDTVAVLTISLINTGHMQTVVTNWSVTADINGTEVQGIIVPKPRDISFDTSGHGEDTPIKITHRGEDNILDKSVNPIQTGALLSGDLFVLFKDVDSESFKTGALITVKYSDALSHVYASNVRSGGRFTVSGPLPGLHTEMVCRPQSGQMFPQTPAPPH